MERPPKWLEVLNKKQSLLGQAFESKALAEVLAHAQEKYVYWDVFKHYKFPKEFSPEEGWTILKLQHRLGKEGTPIKSKESDEYFSYSLTKTLFRHLNFIDTHAAGLIRTFAEKPTPAQKEQLIISGLSEEAIASSQIEGANTSRKVAKEMIYSERKPKNRSEQMIINNYRVMQHLDNLKDLDLTESILLDIQDRITKETLDDARDAGRFRVDADQIVVSNRLTGEVSFVPPKEDEMHRELKRLIAYANEEDGAESNFLHPFIKAVILHFWLAYLHPFVDGNGRTARALFYWYLMKRGYWLFQYLSVSRVIKTSKGRYDDAFLHSELDESDFTYFLLYITEVTSRAIEDLMAHYERKVKEAELNKRIARVHADLNERQISIIRQFKDEPDEVIDIKTHQTKQGVVYETARRDLQQLASKGLITEVLKRKKKVYLPNLKEIHKLIK